ncbi:MAG: glutamate-1-semialdehyde 2,1-aminomutase [Victivallaceae bacterium]
MTATISVELFQRAKKLIPGGVNSPVRAFNSVKSSPIYIQSGKGAFMYDVDGREYLDFCYSWGPLILGHAHPAVIEAVNIAVAEGLSFGACNPREVEMAELLNRQIPYLEMVRMVNSGTEAVMTALRLARGATGRRGIIKFDGCYHGHSDCMLVSAGSGLLTGGISSSAGVSDSTASEVIVAPYNNIKALEEIFSICGKDIAAVIVEPIAGNMGLVPPVHGFLEGLRELTEKHGSLLIFDEVITGFRTCPGTFGQVCGVTPDLTCLGKIIGGGMPIGAVGGKTDIMSQLAPLGPVYQAGTLSGNPVALAAGLTTLDLLIEENPYPQLKKMTETIASELNSFAQASGLNIHCNHHTGMFTLFFTGKTHLHNLDDVKTCDTAAFARFHRSMLEQGIYLPPSQFELSFVSTANSDRDIERYLDAAKKSLAEVAI